MKQQLILWISSIILTFLIGYTRNVTDEYYPVTGTLGIEGQKVSYKLDKVHYGDEPYKLIVLTEYDELSIKCVWKSDGEWMVICSGYIEAYASLFIGFETTESNKNDFSTTNRISLLVKDLNQA